MKSYAHTTWIRGLVYALCLLMAAPPAVLAQTFGTPGGLPLGGAPGTAAPLPGQPIVTNPTALQPINPVPTPCPPPATMMTQGAPPSPQVPTLQGPSGLAQAAGAGAPAVPQGSLSPGGQQPAGPLPAAGGRATPSPSAPASLPAHPGLLSPVIQQQTQELLQPGASLGGQPLQGPVGDLSIEENFARFFILQGVTAQLKQFGYRFFEAQFSGFPPVMDTPVGPDYVLGPDDTLMLHIWNVPDSSFNRSYVAPVERDGTIFIPQVGSIPIAGASFAEATRLLRAKLSGLLKRFEIHLSMARLRTIKVYVVGEVARPGAYEVSSLATVSHALYAACGPTRAGSLRSFHLVRNGRTFADLDFYDFLLRGDRSQDLRLQSGDTVVVPTIGPVAAIVGPIKRPAVYELRNRTTLTQLIELAGGLAPTAERRRCQIFRVEAGRQRVILDIALGDLLLPGRADVINTPSPSARTGQAPQSEQSGSEPTPRQDPLIVDGDIVRFASVPTQIENAVSLVGAVRTPGPYEYRPGMRLRDLLAPEQMLPDSDREHAELIRTELVTYKTTVIPFSPARLFRGEENANVVLQRLDKVVVATQMRAPGIVTLQGEVRRQGPYTIERGEHLSSVLRRAGGFTDTAFPQGIVFIRDSVKRKQQEQLQRFIAAERERLTAEAASTAAGATGTPGMVSTAFAGATLPQQQALALQLQQLEATAARVELGRVVVRLESIEALEGTEEDLILEDLDTMVIPQSPQTISIIGSVKNPSNVVYQKGVGLEDYVRQAGGMTESANAGEIYVVHANGAADSRYLRLKDIKQGDTIVVPPKVEAKTPRLALWQAVAGIIGSAALATAAIAVVGR